MPIVDPKTASTLRAAVDSPDAYSTGSERKKLRAAFDIACSQITKTVFGFESQNRTMLRARLNAPASAQFAEDYSDIVDALKEALAACDPLYTKGYEEAEDETVAFIESELTNLVEEIEAIENG